jgi:hypothetical protein
MAYQAAKCGHEHGAYLPSGSEPGQGYGEHDLRCTLLPSHAGDHEDLSFKPFGGSTYAWRTRVPPRHELGSGPETEPEYGGGMLTSELFNDRRD